MTQTKEQLKSKAKITAAHKQMEDDKTALMKHLNGKATDTPGGGMFRVCNGAQFLGNYWGYTKAELSTFLKKNLSWKDTNRKLTLMEL